MKLWVIALVSAGLFSRFVAATDTWDSYGEGEDASLYSRIVGGKETNIREHAHQVSILLNGIVLCGGSVVSETVVLTAAHCFDMQGVYHVRAGTSKKNVGGSMHDVAEIIIHPKFGTFLYDYDIAIMKMATPFIYSDVVRPIGLPSEGEEVPVGTFATVTGVGSTQVEKPGEIITLQEVKVPILSMVECTAAYGKIITPRQMCAGYEHGRHDACQGDSGGPMTLDGVLIGIVSFGIGCAQAEYPGVYTKVSSLRSWITQYTGL